MLGESLRILVNLKEKNSTHVHFVDLTEPYYDEFAQLSADLHHSAGNATIVVHPFFHREDHGIRLPWKYKLQLNNLMADSLKRRVPVILFEEAEAVEQLAEKVPSGKYYLVQTIEEDPTPLTSDAYKTEGFDNGPKTGRDVLLNFAGQLITAGMRQAFIAGRYYFVNPLNSDYEARFQQFCQRTGHNESARQWIDNGLYPDGCVSGVIEALLQNGVPVQVTRAVSPNTPNPPVRPFSRLDFST